MSEDIVDLVLETQGLKLVFIMIFSISSETLRYGGEDIRAIKSNLSSVIITDN